MPKWLPVEGYPPVQRLFRGHLYYIQNGNDEQQYAVGEFRGLKNGEYRFVQIVNNTHLVSSYGFTIKRELISYRRIRDTTYEDMPLYINAKTITPFYKRLVSGQPMRLRRKLKRSTKSLIRKA